VRNILISFVLIFLFILNAHSDEINFEKGTFDEILQKAKSESKIVMIDFYTGWCGWCKKLDEEVYKDKDVAVFANANQINWKIDAEKGEGPSIAKKYGVDGFPTIVFVDSEAKEIDRISGYVPAMEFLEIMKDYNAGVNTMMSLKAAIEKNPDDPEINYRLGKKYERNSDAKETEKYYKKVISLDPDNKTGFKDKAAFGLAMMEENMDAIKKFIYEYPESSMLKDAYIELIYYFSDDSELDSMKKYYDLAVSKSGENDKDLNKAYANALLYYTYNIAEVPGNTKGGYEKALELTDISYKYLKGEMNEASVHYVKSKLFYRLDDKENANKEIDIAIGQLKEGVNKKPYLDFKAEINK